MTNQQLFEAIQDFRAAVKHQFALTEERTNRRFDQVDARLLRIETRVEHLETRMESIEGRVDRLETTMSSGFNDVRQRLTALEGRQKRR